MRMASGKLEAFANFIWYGKSRLFYPLLPLSWLFAAIAAVRRFLYRAGVLKSYRVAAPVIIVGNIAVGGVGKTPITLWLAGELKVAGFNPAIISRGYGGKGASDTLRVLENSDPAIAGDEPVLLARRARCSVFVDRDRVRAASMAVAEGADIIISDDGLQHYRLKRDAEIVVIDGTRGIGNGHLLPAGPLREPESRLEKVDRIMVQIGRVGDIPRYGNRKSDQLVSRFSLHGVICRNVRDNSERPVKDFAGREVHAIAGIANPMRFFSSLEQHDIDVIPHPRPDHASYTLADVTFGDGLDIIMTEKDAVKCHAFAHKRMWYLPVNVSFADDEKLHWLHVLVDRLRDQFFGIAS